MKNATENLKLSNESELRIAESITSNSTFSNTLFKKLPPNVKTAVFVSAESFGIQDFSFLDNVDLKGLLIQYYQNMNKQTGLMKIKKL